MDENKIFRLRPEAEHDLEKIYEYSVQEFGPERTERYIRDLNDAFSKLANEPSLGRNYDFVRPKLLAFNVVSHVVFFKPSQKILDTHDIANLPHAQSILAYNFYSPC